MIKTVYANSNKQRKKAEQAGWVFDYSAKLKMEYALRKTNNGIEIMTADNVRYSPDEIKIIFATTKEITPDIHTAKRIFKGKIIVDKW